jgi:hypothetical protein
MTERKINADFHDAIRQFDNETSVLSKDYASFSYVRPPYPYPQVFYDTPLLVEKWSRFAKVLSVTPKGHGCYQTAILLRK